MVGHEDIARWRALGATLSRPVGHPTKSQRDTPQQRRRSVEVVSRSASPLLPPSASSALSCLAAALVVAAPLSCAWYVLTSSPPLCLSACVRRPTQPLISRVRSSSLHAHIAASCRVVSFYLPLSFECRSPTLAFLRARVHALTSAAAWLASTIARASRLADSSSTLHSISHHELRAQRLQAAKVQGLLQDRVPERGHQGHRRVLAQGLPQVHHMPNHAQPQDRRLVQQGAVLPHAFAQGLAHSGRR